MSRYGEPFSDMAGAIMKFQYGLESIEIPLLPRPYPDTVYAIIKS